MRLCKTGMWLKTKDDADNTAITRWASTGRSVAELKRIMAEKFDYPAKETNLKAHVKHRCTCDR